MLLPGDDTQVSDPDDLVADVAELDEPRTPGLAVGSAERGHGVEGVGEDVWAVEVGEALGPHLAGVLVDGHRRLVGGELAEYP